MDFSLLLQYQQKDAEYNKNKNALTQSYTAITALKEQYLALKKKNDMALKDDLANQTKKIKELIDDINKANKYIKDLEEKSEGDCDSKQMGK